MNNTVNLVYVSIAAALAVATVVITKDSPKPDILAVDNLYERKLFIKTSKIQLPPEVNPSVPVQQAALPQPANLPQKGLPQPVDALPIVPTEPTPQAPQTVQTVSSRDVLEGKWIQAGDAQVAFVLGNKTDVDKSQFPTIPITIKGIITGVGEFTAPVREEYMQQNGRIELDIKDKSGKVTRHDISFVRNIKQGGYVELNFNDTSSVPVQRIQEASPEDLPPPPPSF